jgi:ribosomal protein S12 methylthiotransferase
MRRGTPGRVVRETVARVRERAPGAALRTSLLVGFPGETDADFEELLAFAREAAFEHLGVFRFSPQEGTEAAALRDPVPEAVARERAQRLLDLQETIVEDRARRALGTRPLVLVDREDEEGVWGRTEADAPEIDGAVLLPRGSASAGDFLHVHITEASGATLFGEPAR